MNYGRLSSSSRPETLTPTKLNSVAVHNLMQNKRELDVKKLNTIQEGQKRPLAAGAGSGPNFTAPNSKAKFIKTAQSWAKGYKEPDSANMNGVSDFRGAKARGFYCVTAGNSLAEVSDD